MLLEIQFSQATPPYLQIVEQISHSVASGRLQSGVGLPSIRQLAEKLQVNRNTVDKAYRELESRGVVEIRRGKGAFVVDAGSPLSESRRLAQLGEAVDRLVIEAHHLRFDDQTVLDMLNRRLQDFRVARSGDENGASAANGEEGGQQ